jgi:hypothetical protein
MGGGGYGDPLLRAPELVLRDVINGLVTPEWAEKTYGVVVRGAPLRVDRLGTVEARQAIYKQRRQTAWRYGETPPPPKPEPAPPSVEPAVAAPEPAGVQAGALAPAGLLKSRIAPSIKIDGRTKRGKKHGKTPNIANLETMSMGNATTVPTPKRAIAKSKPKRASVAKGAKSKAQPSARAGGGKVTKRSTVKRAKLAPAKATGKRGNRALRGTAKGTKPAVKRSAVSGKGRVSQRSPSKRKERTRRRSK